MKKSSLIKQVVAIAAAITLILTFMNQGALFVIADPNGPPGDGHSFNPIGQLIGELCDPSGPPGDGHSFNPIGQLISDLCDPNDPPKNT
ncbi:MAG: hypothetical protein ACFFD4_23250 [Candidatus Odinarchaeota archaeon]